MPRSPRSVLLLVNRAKPEVAQALAEVRALIGQSGRVVAELDAAQTPISTADAKGADLIVVLGGDGTLMSQSSRCLALGLPMLGVNLGKLGFMAEFDLPALRAQSAAIFDGSPLEIQDRPLLRAAVVNADGSPAPGISADPAALMRSLSLNDAVITAGPPYRMISISIRIDGHAGPTVSGDGLIVATPIGSTAYNVSSGGPIVSPDVAAMVITPIAAHSLAFRPVVVAGSSVIELVLDRVNDSPADPGPTGGSALVLDGQVTARLRAGQRVVIRQHDRMARFVRNPKGSYWGTLITKMRWAAPPATRQP